MFKRVIGLFLAMSMVAVSFAGCKKTESSSTADGGTTKAPTQKITVVLDWTPNTNHTGLYVAKDLGYYTAEGIEIDLIQPPEGGALALVAAGKADFAVSFQEEVLMSTNARTPLPVVAIASMVEHNTGGILSIKDKNITRFKDMEGKSYGSWEMPIYDEIVKDCIKQDGGDPDKLKMIPNSATDSIVGIQKDFDTVWVFEGWDKVIAEQKGVQTNFFKFSDVNPVFDYYTPVLVTSEKILKDKSDMVKKFLKATEKGYAYAKDNAAASADILSKYAPEVDKNVLKASQEFLSKAYFSTKWGTIDAARWNAFFDWMKQKEIVSKDAKNSGFQNVDFS